MRRQLFIFLMALVAGLLSVGPTYAPTITVCASGCDYSSIQDAVDNAAPGDTVVLAAEVFTETVTIGHPGPLTVRGAGPEHTTVEHDGTGGPHITVDTTGEVTLADILFQGSPGVAIETSATEVHLAVDNCVVRDSETGISNYSGGETVITNSLIVGNYFGVDPEGGEVTISNTLITGNGVGIYSYGGPDGLTIENTTVSGNDYGAFEVYDAENTQITNSTISGWVWTGACHGEPHLRNTIITGECSFGSECCPWPWGCCPHPPCDGGNRGRTTTSEGFNLSSDDSCAGILNHPTDMNNTDPMLLPLADNGGPTMTHALHPDSPAIDAGGGECEPTDQRGVLRPQDGDGDGIATCDIGAFEFSPPLARVNELIGQVQSLGLHHGIENSLLAKLNAALLILGDLQDDNDHAAANVLGAFIRHVQAQYGKKIAAGDADALIEAAEEIIELLSGGMRIRRGEFQRRLFSPGRRLGSGPQEPE